ncbi:hypothetical protein [Thiothrix lacustris]|uniref:hypothetical protein n=1 Tax=Thiothrix lacustris TaxID=525917 RepID=UPI000491F8B8|nr:hypothetical protein [Thiothrix lacustris]
MTVLRKSEVKPYIDELNEFHTKLVEALMQPPSEDNWKVHSYSAPDFQRDFYNVDLDAIARLMKHYEITAKFTSQLKKKAAKPLG